MATDIPLQVLNSGDEFTYPLPMPSLTLSFSCYNFSFSISVALSIVELVRGQILSLF